MERFENSLLWRNQLAPRDGDRHAEARSVYRTSFLQSREVVSALVSKIGQELPQLTIHDITHLDALWEVSDVVLGEDFTSNPAETFVLGMAFLLHDAATSTFAFAGGIDELRATDEWLDYVAQKGYDESALVNGSEEFNQALFEVLRLRHPQQAKRLIAASWSALENGEVHLIENARLRAHYGEIIGLIAASHGEDIASVEARWAAVEPITPPSDLVSGGSIPWRVDCLKVALALRCVDAAHIDSRRAPTIFAALNRPSGGSLAHWIFQNHLGQVARDQNSEIYWSSSAFKRGEADAWWQLRSTAQMIDREIRGSNKILASNNRPTFASKGVAGSNDLEIFKRNVPVSGWDPVEIQFNVSDVGGVITKFGGSKLYGDEPHMALRELIQNASDAIRALRAIRGDEQIGRVMVRLDEKPDGLWLEVTDTGIGMSQYVLTEVLLDFGRSFWKDASIRQEWPGLVAKFGSPTGQFGIGFFSVFMLGDEVKVTTWRYGDAQENQRTLHLRDSVRSRPLLIETPPNVRLPEFGTRVAVKLKGQEEALLPKLSPYRYGQKPRLATLSETVGMLAPALDIDIWVGERGKSPVRHVRANDWRNLPAEDLLRRLAPGHSDQYLESLASRVTDLEEDDGKLVGRLGLRSSYLGSFGDSLGVLVHNGLWAGRGKFSGILLAKNNDDLARVHATPVCSAAALRQFAARSARKLRTVLSTDDGAALLSIGLKSMAIPIAELGLEEVNGKELRDFLRDRKTLVICAEHISCPPHLSENDFDTYFVKRSDVVFIEPSLAQREELGIKGWLDELLPEGKGNPRSILSFIAEIVGSAWRGAFTTEDEEEVVGSVRHEQITENCVVFRRR